MPACACGGVPQGSAYADCCGRYHNTSAALYLAAPSPEALMRSRYSAFTLGLTDYLMATWHTNTRPSDLELHAGDKWLGLSLKRAWFESEAEKVCFVHFVARYKPAGGGAAVRIEEVSQFEKENARWVYVAAEPESTS